MCAEAVLFINKIYIFASLDKGLCYICSNPQGYLVWVELMTNYMYTVKPTNNILKVHVCYNHIHLVWYAMNCDVIMTHGTWKSIRIII